MLSSSVAVAPLIREPLHAPGVDDHRTGDDHDLAGGGVRSLEHFRELSDRHFDAPLRGDLARHEGEILALPVLELANNLDPRMAADYEVALSDVAQFRASRAIGIHANHGVHALFLHQFPIAGKAHVSPVVRRGVKIIGNSAGS